MKIEELHNQAMEKADLAIVKAFHNDYESAILLNKNAFLLEKEAALLAKKEGVGEPSESVLLKSAAVLAINCSEYREAEKLIALALSCEPPFEISEELRNLLEDINFHRHLELKGITLNPSEFQFVISGNSVGYGIAKPEEVFDRIKTIEKLTYRIVERKSNKPFRKKGSIPKEIKMSFEPYLSAPRAASLAFTIRLGGSPNQQIIPGMNITDTVIDDLFENLELVNKGDLKALKSKIPDNDYYVNFIASSKELAPDGEEINLVGLTVIRDGIKKDVALNRARKDFTSIVEEQQSETNEEITSSTIDRLVGRLSFADDDSNKIRLKTEDNQKHIIGVSDGLIDIVKKYFGENVCIKVKNAGKSLLLLEIDPAQ